MKTTHEIFYKSSQKMEDITDASVHLMITSPPYPMISMWDEIFANQIDGLSSDMIQQKPKQAFDLMNNVLNEIWSEVYRVLVPGGIACINIGDATRTIQKNFQLFPSHVEIVKACRDLGFNSLPGIIWRKPNNSPTKFMGSGMLPPGAYITLEHEHILVFRKGRRRKFTSKEEKQRRRKSAYFWEERNRWFSDLWEITGTSQRLFNNTTRDRSAAYPFDIAHRLINMFSIMGDTVLDPFLGTGTSMLAAMCLQRNSVNYEIDKNLQETIDTRVENIVESSNKLIQMRLAKHYNFIIERLSQEKTFKYVNKNYSFPVVAKQEVKIQFSELKAVKKVAFNRYSISYKPLKTNKYQLNENDTKDLKERI